MLNVHRSTYYKLLRHEPSTRQQKNVEIRNKILTLYAGSDKRLGAKKMRLCLARDYCVAISKGRVYRLMKEMDRRSFRSAEQLKQSLVSYISGYY